jgi:hypothetical protein
MVKYRDNFTFLLSTRNYGTSNPRSPLGNGMGHKTKCSVYYYWFKPRFVGKLLSLMISAELLNINMRFEVLTVVNVKILVFWDVTPCSPVVVHRRFGRTSVNFFQTTRRHIPEDGTLYSHRCENLISNEVVPLYQTKRRHSQKTAVFNMSLYIYSDELSKFELFSRLFVLSLLCTESFFFYRTLHSIIWNGRFIDFQ